MRVSVFILLTIIALPAISQVNCPPLYETREVMCQGTIVTKCVPIDFTCNGCWRIVWPSCKGDWKKGGNQHANSYDAALKITEDRKELFKDGNCRGSVTTDYFEFKIYLLGGNDCNNIISDRRVFNDIKSRVMSLLKDLNAEKVAFDKLLDKLIWDKLAYKPGDIVQEYHDMLKQSENNAQDLSKMLGYIANENITDIEDEIQTLLNFQENLQGLREQIRNDVEEQRLGAKEKKEKKVEERGKSFAEIHEEMLAKEKIKPPVKGKSFEEMNDEKMKKEKKEKLEERGKSFAELNEELQAKRKVEEEKRRKQLKLEEEREVKAEKMKPTQPVATKTPTNNIQGQAKFGYVSGVFFSNSEKIYVFSSIKDLTKFDCSFISKKNDYGTAKSKVDLYEECITSWFKSYAQSTGYSKFVSTIATVRNQDRYQKCPTDNESSCFMTEAAATENRRMIINSIKNGELKSKIVELN